MLKAGDILPAVAREDAEDDPGIQEKLAACSIHLYFIALRSRVKARRGTIVSWRFRKSFKVLPGIKLNLTSRGLSATLGASPFSVNVGPRGVYSNVSIPGTGISSRQRLDAPLPQSGVSGAPAYTPSEAPSTPVAPGGTTDRNPQFQH